VKPTAFSAEQAVGISARRERVLILVEKMKNLDSRPRGKDGWEISGGRTTMPQVTGASFRGRALRGMTGPAEAGNQLFTTGV